MKTTFYTFSVFIINVFLIACSAEKKPKKTIVSPTPDTFILPEGGTLLFNGKDLENWEVTRFGTEGPVQVSDGKIIINMGDGCSGISWTEDFPNVNYEVNLEARRTVGNDFFCGLTFPVNDAFCSYIVGGWGGPVIGLSCIDGVDAGENETNTMKRLEKNVWYKIKLQVTSEKIIGWVDDEKMVDFTYSNRKLSIRPEVELSKPFGICTWVTTAELRNIWMRKLE